MDIKIIILIACAVNFYLGFLVFRRGWRIKSNFGFSMFALSLTLWTLAFYFYEHPFILSGLIWIKIIYLVVFFMIFSLVYFSFYFPIKTERSPFITLVLYCLLAIPQIWLLLFTDLWIQDVVIETWGVATKLGPAYIFPSIFWSMFTFLVFYKWFKIYRRIKGLGKMQLRFVFLGIFFFIILTIIVDAIIPFITGESRYFWLSPVFSLFLAGSVAYTIIKYRLMDIRLVIKRSFVYFSSIIIFLAIFLAIFVSLSKYLLGITITWDRIILGSVIFGLGLIFFNQILKFFERLTNKYIFHSLYTSRQAIEELTKKTTTIIELPKLIDAITDTIIKSMGLNRAGVLLFNDKTSNYQVSKVIGFTVTNGISLVRNNYLIQKLNQTKKPVILQELEFLANQAGNGLEKSDLEKLKTNMKRIEATLCLPLIIKNRLLGIIVLGDKISNEPYTKEDLELLQTLASQSTVAIENAELYQEVQSFSKTLQQKVDSQTKDIKKKNIHLQKLLAMRSEFLDVTSHQLRTPTSVIIGILEMAVDGDLDKIPVDQKQMQLTGAYIKAKKLEQIISDLLRASELDTTPFQLKPEDFKEINPKEFLNRIISFKSLEAKKQGIELSLNQPLPLFNIYGDEHFLDEAIGNLIDNAIKYTPKINEKTKENGKVVLSCAKDNQNVYFKVSDNGIGIPKEEIKKLFEKFVRATNAKEMYTDGTGLGLFVVREIIKGHGGSIKVESKLGEGSTFTVTLPLRQMKLSTALSR